MIAAVQAYYLKHFFLVGKGNSASDVTFKSNCLVAAMADLLYKVAQQGTGNVVVAVASRPSAANEAVTLEACDQLVFQAQSLRSVYE